MKRYSYGERDYRFGQAQHRLPKAIVAYHLTTTNRFISVPLIA
jgi:hypothetical protein